jgi:hypothetical protein
VAVIVSRVAQSAHSLAIDRTTGRSRFNIRQRRKDFSSSLFVQTGSEAHPASCTMGTWSPFPGAKARPGSDADHSPPSSAEVENEQELYILSPQVPSWRVVGQLQLYDAVITKVYYLGYISQTLFQAAAS